MDTQKNPDNEKTRPAKNNEEDSDFELLMNQGGLLPDFVGLVEGFQQQTSLVVAHHTEGRDGQAGMGHQGVEQVLEVLGKAQDAAFLVDVGVVR